jgi:hypothetical protein
MKQIESTLPVFRGFYGSIFEFDNESEEIEYAIENGHAPEGATYDDFTFDYKDYNLRVAKSMVDSIDNALTFSFDMKMTFVEISSPQYYNFSNDKIIVNYEMDNEVFTDILDYLKDNRDKFDEYVKDRFTSYDGFMSFYSNDTDVWFDDYLKDSDKLETLFGSVLDFICKNEDIDDEVLIEGMCDETWINYTYKTAETK